MKKIEILKQNVENLLGSEIITATLDNNEFTIVVDADCLFKVMMKLRDNESTDFEQCVDICGLDYLTYHDDYSGLRFAVVYHLLSIKNNWRLRVRSFAKDDNNPVMPSVVKIWSGANWFEREAFDFFGITFINHPDLRRILTDYDFVGYPFRKDFPVSGHVEMIYDSEKKKVVYQPITIEPREITPRVIREEGYCARN